MTIDEKKLLEKMVLTPVILLVPTSKEGQSLLFTLADLVNLGMVKDSSVTKK